MWAQHNLYRHQVLGRIKLSQFTVENMQIEDLYLRFEGGVRNGMSGVVLYQLSRAFKIRKVISDVEILYVDPPWLSEYFIERSKLVNNWRNTF